MIHDTRYKCNAGIKYKVIDAEQRKFRSSYAWTQKSKEVREKANHLCEVCRDGGRYEYRNISVHHIKKITDDKSLALDNSNLICLCKIHHALAENGDIDTEYLLQLAEKRENG